MCVGFDLQCGVSNKHRGHIGSLGSTVVVLQ